MITPSFNQGDFIENTIRSVLAQDYPEFEHFVVDGGSTDTTVSVLGRYSHLQWVSEPDTGQSNALNKGFSKASGDIIAWINSDDWYVRGAFDAVARFFFENPDKDVVMGDCNLVDESGDVFDKVINCERGFRELRRHWVALSIPTQPAVFFRKKLLDDVGFLNESLHYAMDFDLWLRLAKRARFYHLAQVVANYRFHPAAKGGLQDWSRFRPEFEKVYRRHVSVKDMLLDIPSRSYHAILRHHDHAAAPAQSEGM